MGDRHRTSGAVASLLTAVALVAACGGGASDQTVTETSDRKGTMELTSPAFDDQGTIPVRYTCDGLDISPPLRVDELPQATATMVLIVDDPDAPSGTWDHWVVYDIAPRTDIAEGVEGLGTDGSNSWGRLGYGGPCPPSGTHRYVHRLFALDIGLGLGEGASKAELLAAMEGHVLGQATLTGRYGR